MGELDKETSLNFLSTRAFYAHEKECNGKPCWVTKDRRFAGAKSGATLSISWSTAGDAGSRWVLADGEPGAEGATVYAVAPLSESPKSGEKTEWEVTQEAKDLAAQRATDSAAGTAAEPLVKDQLTTTFVDVGSLREKLLELANRLNYTGANIFVIDGSSRSAHSNAFCTGFGRFRRICLFDTLLPLMEEQEIIAVLGHEIGHDRLFHVHTMLVFSLSYIFVMLFAMGQFLTSASISSAFYVSEPKVYLGIVLFSVVWGVIDFAVSIPQVCMSRMNEFAADRYSVDANETYAKSLGDGLKKLMRKSKANLTPHPLYAFLNYSHPPLDQRLKAICEYNQKRYNAEALNDYQKKKYK